MDLMDELQKELYRLHAPQSYLFSSAMAPEPTGRIWQMHHLTEVSTTFSKAAVAGIEDVKPSLDLLKNMQSGQILRQNGDSLKDGELLDSKLKSLPKQMLDLRLPADLYINVENFDRKEKEDIVKPFSRVRENSSTLCDIELEKDVKLTLGNREDCSKYGWNSNPIWQNGQSTQRYDYMNEYEKGLGCEGQHDSVSNPFLCVKTTREEFHAHQLQTTSTRSFLPQEFFTLKHRDKGDCSNICNGDKRKSGEEWPSFNSKDGLSSEKYAMLSQASKPNIKKYHSFPYDNCEMQKWFEEKPTPDIGLYQESSTFVYSNDSELTNSEVPGPFSVIPCSEYMSCEAPMVLTKRKPPPRVITHVPIAVQALPCFPASEMMNLKGRKHKGLGRKSTKKLLSDVDLKPHPRIGIEISPSQNVYQDLWSDSVSATQFNHRGESSVYEKSESYVSQKFPKVRNGVSFRTVLQTGTSEDGKIKESSKGRSWGRTNPFCADSRGKFSISKDLNQSPENFPSALPVKLGKKKKRNRNLQWVGTAKILGFPIENELQKNAICRSANGINTGKSEVGIVIEKGAREGNIDLNTLAVSSEEDEVPNLNGVIIDEIDLEIPFPSYETPDIVAAENLVVMSLGLTEQWASASCDSLHWFANMVSSEGANNADHDIVDDGVDVFESSMLQLEEMKPEEYSPLPQAPEGQKDEKDACTISLLLTKTRRGLLRKRRQKKDFQKDILPGIVPLSRHEVTEDLQAFDCLMRAMGEDWQCNLTRQKGSSGQGRGRRRPRELGVSVAEKCSSPPPAQAEPNSDTKVEINGRSIVGWGRTTRRGRSPRVKRGNGSPLVS